MPEPDLTDKDTAEDVALTAAAFRDGTFCVGLDICAVLLPSFATGLDDREVASHTELGVHYWVSVRELSCTCPDFATRRAQFGAPDARRVCKHILNELRQDHLMGWIDEIAIA
jgi:hypothetical protein